MRLVQLAVEGVRGFDPKVSFRFSGRLDVLQVGTEAERTSLVDVLFHTLYPDAERPDATADLADPAATQPRAVLTVLGKDRVPHYLTRALDSGRSHLYRLNQELQKHEVLTDSAAELQQFLRTTFHLPDDVSFERLFMITGQAKASDLEHAKSRTGALRLGFGSIPPSGPGLPARDPSSEFGASSTYSGVSMSALDLDFEDEEEASTGTLDVVSESSDEELLGLYHALGASRDRIERIDRLKAILKQLDEREEAASEGLERVKGAGNRLAQAEQALKSEKELLDLPEDIEARIASYRSRVKLFEKEQRRLQQSVQRTEAKPEATATLDLHTARVGWFVDPAFLAASAATGLFGGLALLLGIKALLVAQVLGGLVAGGLAVRALEKQKVVQEHSEELEQAKTRLASARKAFQVDTSMVRGIVKRVGLANVDSLEQRLNRLRALEKHIAQLREESEQARKFSQESREVLANIRERRAATQTELSGLGKATGRRELDLRLFEVETALSERGLIKTKPKGRFQSRVNFDDEDEEEMVLSFTGTDGGESQASPNSDRGPYLLIGTGGVGSGSFPPAGEGGGLGGTLDRVQVLTETAADLVGEPPEQVLKSCVSRIGEYANALTEGQFGAARVSRDGLSVQRRGGQWVAFDELEGHELDCVDVGLRLGLVERVLKVRKAPVWFEEPFLDVPPEQRSVVLKIYRHLSRMTQVLVITQAGDVSLDDPL